MDEFLIEKVREHQVIYNQNLRQYRDQLIRQQAWEEIGRELNITGNEAKQRWDQLRRCFCNARNRRREETKSDISAKRKSCWKYEQQMEFLLPFMESRKTHTNSDVLVNRTETEDFRLETSNTEDFKIEPFDTEEIPPEEVHYLNDPLTEIESLEETANSTENTNSNDVKCYEALPKKLKNSDSPAHEMVKILPKQRKYEEEKLLHSLDETDMFFLSMSRMTKKLPKRDQAQIKLTLSNLVLSTEIKNCDQL